MLCLVAMTVQAARNCKLLGLMDEEFTQKKQGVMNARLVAVACVIPQFFKQISKITFEDPKHHKLLY